ncbi:MAG: ATP-binding cassette domain-containing protein, partial [Fimbriimonadaceae bacterium]|nr:ATP-binding cassette domain-containing protein [Alphaproteobacteria bacterium]
MLDVSGIDLQYGDALALQDVSITAGAGEIVVIIGANGAGKTSLIKAIAGIHKTSRGQIRFRDRDITGKPSSEICNLGIGQVAEGRKIFPSMSVEENLEMGAVIKRARADAAANM